MKLVCSLVFITALFGARAWSASEGHWISGKVKSFSEKSIIIEKNGKLFEYDIKHVKNRKDLKPGADITIDLD